MDVSDPGCTALVVDHGTWSTSVTVVATTADGLSDLMLVRLRPADADMTAGSAAGEWFGIEQVEAS